MIVASQACGLTSPSDETLRPICAVVCMLMQYTDPFDFRAVVLEVRDQWSAKRRGTQRAVRERFAFPASHCIIPTPISCSLGVRRPSVLKHFGCDVARASACISIGGICNMIGHTPHAVSCPPQRRVRIIGVSTYTDPSQLPGAVYTNAYPDESDPPISNTIIGLNTMLSKMPMRSTHHSISKRVGRDRGWVIRRCSGA